jgi:hypothetical protein
MSLKENLKRKMTIDRLSRAVSKSMPSPGGSTRKIDKESMRKLISFTPFVEKKTRDLELYFREFEPGVGDVLCLDNELPLYSNAMVEDVALRRSPEVKEMVSIRNIIKILNDKDILNCKGSDAVQYITDRALELLDLTFNKEDVEEMANDGVDALVRADSDDVMETLELFVELLGYASVPAAALVNDFVMFGYHHEAGNGKQIFGPIVMYNDKTNVLRLIKQTVSISDPAAQTLIAGVALGEMDPDGEGPQVFQFLQDAALDMDRPTIH